MIPVPYNVRRLFRAVPQIRSLGCQSENCIWRVKSVIFGSPYVHPEVGDEIETEEDDEE